ncbi:hypothetical protein [Saccharothrix syringae]|uniref:hypothetical protein n=1 Tax=Saccharothrix syringae TaxID=103733 RepID=UPI000ADAF2E0|nr:hypothetical protein [Saccharothrix syringae]
MSSTPIYDELAAILLVDQPATTEATGQHQAAPAVEEPAKQARTGGRRRKPEPEV